MTFDIIRSQTKRFTMQVQVRVDAPKTDASVPNEKSGKLCGRKVCYDLSLGWACSIVLTVSAVVLSTILYFKWK